MAEGKTYLHLQHMLQDVLLILVGVQPRQLCTDGVLSLPSHFTCVFLMFIPRSCCTAVKNLGNATLIATVVRSEGRIRSRLHDVDVDKTLM